MRDDWFARGKVPMTKQEVRAVSISALELSGDSILLDIGSGTGSIGAEAAKVYPGLYVAAFEKNPEGVLLTRENLQKAGAESRSEVIVGEVPETLREWISARIRERKPLATHAFLGGTGGHMAEVLDLLAKAMPHIRIVANVIALETLEQLLGWTGSHGITPEISQVQISRGEMTGKYTMMRGQNPVWVISFSAGENGWKQVQPGEPAGSTEEAGDFHRGDIRRKTNHVDRMLGDFRNLPEEKLEEEYRNLIRAAGSLKLSEEAAESAAKRWSEGAMPLGGLGSFQEIVVQLAGIAKTPDVQMENRALVVFCGDNGIVEEGVSQTGQDVTAKVVHHMADHTGVSSLMAKKAGCDLFALDLGIACDMDSSGVIDRKIFHGTRNFLRENAMSRKETLAAILTGADMARVLKECSYQMVLGGEMGIGNTTTASAVTALLLGADPEEVTGRGAGLSESGLKRKTEVIREGICRRDPDPADITAVISSFGGADIAGLTGLILGCAAAGLPVVLDGFITLAAALAAYRICPEALLVMIPSHVPAEQGAERIFSELPLSPAIRAGLHLGEGTGALMLLPMLDMALEVYRRRVSFDEMEVEAYQPL
ncbi:MAG: nicotinate-nucleotide--dimethylbenzimidazole phosphoribosyltransferase [Clostridium sp.]|nr:nicotinate-nucleotide--dimethylbenzimidazole phosphoribosyltransferase [Clostridium sp.]MBP3216019.1 nicotinate-nucleotide--dimethylbenzimidazole phosphoribosyltransferase [Clostridium sp.]